MSLIRNQQNNPAGLGMLSRAGDILVLCWDMLAHK